MDKILSQQQYRLHCKPEWSSPLPVAIPPVVIPPVSLNSKFEELSRATTQRFFDCDSDQSHLTMNNTGTQCVFNPSGIFCVTGVNHGSAWH